MGMMSAVVSFSLLLVGFTFMGHYIPKLMHRNDKAGWEKTVGNITTLTIQSRHASRDTRMFDVHGTVQFYPDGKPESQSWDNHTGAVFVDFDNDKVTTKEKNDFKIHETIKLWFDDKKTQDITFKEPLSGIKEAKDFTAVGVVFVVVGLGIPLYDYCSAQRRKQNFERYGVELD